MADRSEIDVEWARSQVEAFADGTLRGEQRARMRKLLREHPEVALEVERARSLRVALRHAGRHRIPTGLRANLLAVARRPGSSWTTFAAPAAVAAALVVALVVFWQAQPRRTAESPPVAQAEVEQAIGEFNLAMRYLRVGAERSREQLDDALRFSVRVAMTVGNEAARERPLEDRRNERNGEQP